MKSQQSLWIIISISSLNFVITLVQFIRYLSDEVSLLVYLYGLILVVLSLLLVVTSLDLYKKDWIIKKAKMVRNHKNKYWFETDKGKTVSYTVRDQDVIDRIVTKEVVKLVITKRTRQLVRIN
ncbi:hypothetical protein [Bacillus horti]|uniref:Uncharacterized protein n=1 Tax=Caldalkalibacillus horti TaxID=77523 RepID=A0ABT9VXP0_9BACI|nr:hypothetical protein [Bacillus horti]MDQ0165759.1 hypothetical protein [Bacillus horti]